MALLKGQSAVLKGVLAELQLLPSTSRGEMGETSLHCSTHTLTAAQAPCSDTAEENPVPPRLSPG